jgi:predicted transcriptional regulator
VVLSPNSHLQNRILLHLNHGSAESVTALAQGIQAPRPSVSRAVNELIKARLVIKDGRQVCLTNTGRSVAEVIKQRLPERVEQEAKAVTQLWKQAHAAQLLPQFAALSDTVSSVFGSALLPSPNDLGFSHVMGQVLANHADVLATIEPVLPVLPDLVALDHLHYFLPPDSVLGSLVDLGQYDFISALQPDLIDVLAQARLAAASTNFPMLEEVAAVVRDTLQPAITSLFQEFGPWYKEFQDTFDELDKAGHTIGPMLLVAGFWVSPSTPYSLLLRIKELSSTGEMTPETLQQLFVSAYRLDECVLLRETVYGWQDDSLFAARMPIFLDALEAHCAGKYTLSIPALLPQIESIASELTGVPHGKTFEAVTKAAGRAGTEFVPAIAREVLLAYITTMAYADTRKPAFQAELLRLGVQPQQVLQRHAILHGQVVDYANEENSLRAFLLLDALAHIPTPGENPEPPSK